MTVVAVLDLGWGEVVEFAVEAFVVEPGDPAAGLEFEVVEAAPVAAVACEHGGVAVQFGLEQPDRGLGQRVDAPMSRSCREGGRRAEGLADFGEDLTGDVALEQPKVSLRLAPVAVRRAA